MIKVAPPAAIRRLLADHELRWTFSGDALLHAAKNSFPAYLDLAESVRSYVENTDLGTWEQMLEDLAHVEGNATPSQFDCPGCGSTHGEPGCD